MRFFLIFTILISVTSCNSLREWREERLAKRYDKYNQMCVKKGFTPNTDAFRLCIQNLQIQRRLYDAETDRLINSHQQKSNTYINNLLYPKK